MSAENTPWQAALSLADLGRLTGDWLAGRLDYHPGHPDGALDLGPAEIIDLLVAINRCGMVTLVAQTGLDERDGDGVPVRWRHPAVWALLADKDLPRLNSAFTDVHLYEQSAIPRLTWHRKRVRAGYDVTWFRDRRFVAPIGRDMHTRDLRRWFGGQLSRSALAEASAAWQVVLIGRDAADTELWRGLKRFAAIAGK
jgi:hypothetical protein